MVKISSRSFHCNRNCINPLKSSDCVSTQFQIPESIHRSRRLVSTIILESSRAKENGQTKTTFTCGISLLSQTWTGRIRSGRTPWFFPVSRIMLCHSDEGSSNFCPQIWAASSSSFIEPVSYELYPYEGDSRFNLFFSVGTTILLSCFLDFNQLWGDSNRFQ